MKKKLLLPEVIRNCPGVLIMATRPPVNQHPQYGKVESQLQRQLSQRIGQFNEQARLLTDKCEVESLKKFVKFLGRCQAAGDELLKLKTNSLAPGRFENLVATANGAVSKPIQSLREKKPRKKTKKKFIVKAPKQLGYARATRVPPKGKGYVIYGIGQTRKPGN